MAPVQPDFGRNIQRIRKELGLSQEALALKANLHRTAIGKIESGERDPSLSTSISISNALGVPLQEIFEPRNFRKASGHISDMPAEINGIDKSMIKRAIEEVYSVLDLIDFELEKRSVPKISSLIELANVSAMVGNIFGGALAKASNGYWVRSGPHKYPDLIRPRGAGDDGIELKVALENNTPKGHLPKPGKHISIRYVLAHSKNNFKYLPNKRGDTVSIWEIKCGHLSETDFSVSNTPGDSGKTANFSSDAFKRMKLIYFDKSICPFSNIKKYLSEHGPVLP